MGKYNDYGYGSASSSASSSPRGYKDSWMSLSQLQSCLQQMSLQEAAPAPLASSFGSVGSVTQRHLDDVMLDFQMNGSDSPYDPAEEAWTPRAPPGKNWRYAGMGPASAYLRQKSWPEPEATPALPLPRPEQRTQEMEWESYGGGQWREGYADYTSPSDPTAIITAEQIKVLQSLSNVALYSLLRDLQAGRQDKMTAAGRFKGKRGSGQDECRFCKNNREQVSYFRNHVLKDQAGRVQCPVLRAFVCKRCGATGDHAHTIKYCPFSSDEERGLSAAMMRSVRMASGRKRTSSVAASVGAPWYDNNYDAAPSCAEMSYCSQWNAQLLDPEWAALEKKLMQ